jgi:phosphate/sulfate permease
MQVLSACAVSFSHGANDVANAIGSFTAAYYTWQNGKVRHATLHSHNRLCSCWVFSRYCSICKLYAVVFHLFLAQ